MSDPPPQPKEDPSPYEVPDGKSPYKADIAAYFVQEQLREDLQKIDLQNLSDEHVDPATLDGEKLPERSKKCTEQEPHVPAKNVKVGIVGAGIAGLYAAYMLDWIGVPYEILEASKRIGGRLYTHEFSEDPHDYYDIGAMRFPRTPIMKRTFDLFKECDLKLGDYYMESKKQPTRYNDRNAIGRLSDLKIDDPFHVTIRNGGNVPTESIKYPEVMLDDAYDRFRRKIKRALRLGKKEDLHNAFKYLMNHDRYSLRDYLSFVEGYDYETIQWLETQFSATGWFGEAFTENVLESFAFEWTTKGDLEESKDLLPDLASEVQPDVWKYIEGGSSRLTDAMERLIKKKHPEGSPIHTGKQVVAIELQDVKIQALKNTPLDQQDQNVVKVDIKGEEPRYYASVINTTTLAALQKMDLTGLQLPYAMKSAIRSLRYDPSTKVAIKFKEKWWIKDYGIRGGLGKTDMPLRVCVYPSYSIYDKADEPGVLLCSYTWGQDSERIASMVPSDDMKEDEKEKMKAALKHTMLTELARLHAGENDNDGAKYRALLERLENLYVDIHGYDWSKDPYTCGGAFALFAPGQFSRVYPNIVRPAADARFHIVGEAASAHHAWVVGALDSAYRGVWAMLERFHLHELQRELRKKFGDAGEMSDTHLQVAFGRLPPRQQPSARRVVAS